MFVLISDLNISGKIISKHQTPLCIPHNVLHISYSLCTMAYVYSYAMVHSEYKI